MIMTTTAKKSIVFLMDHWQSTAGGIQTVNRELACSVARQEPDVECIALVTAATPEERSHAFSQGVRLIAGREAGDWSDAVLSKELQNVAAEGVFAVVGHSYFSGAQAIGLKERFFPRALSVHFVHMSPLDTESVKEYRTTSYVEARENKVRKELKIAKRADIVACIGPRLRTYMQDQLTAQGARGRVVRIDCGLQRTATERTSPLRPTFLCLGRTDSINVKGLDIFAYAAGHFTREWARHPLTSRRPPPQFIVRGANSTAGDRCVSTTELRR